MKYKLIGIALLIFAIYSCATKLATVANKPTETVTSNSVAIAEGKNLYENNCAKCHKLFDPKERTKEEYGKLLEQAGLRLTRVISTKSPYSVIEGERA